MIQFWEQNRQVVDSSWNFQVEPWVLCFSWLSDVSPRSVCKRAFEVRYSLRGHKRTTSRRSCCVEKDTTTAWIGLRDWLEYGCQSVRSITLPNSFKRVLKVKRSPGWGPVEGWSQIAYFALEVFYLNIHYKHTLWTDLTFLFLPMHGWCR